MDGRGLWTNGPPHSDTKLSAFLDPNHFTSCILRMIPTTHLDTFLLSKMTDPQHVPITDIDRDSFS